MVLISVFIKQQKQLDVRKSMYQLHTLNKALEMHCCRLDFHVTPFGIIVYILMEFYRIYVCLNS